MFCKFIGAKTAHCRCLVYLWVQYLFLSLVFSYMAITFLACLQVTVSWDGISNPLWKSGNLLCLTSIILEETLASNSNYNFKNENSGLKTLK